jgi:hypothetical protein
MKVGGGREGDLVDNGAIAHLTTKIYIFLFVLGEQQLKIRRGQKFPPMAEMFTDSFSFVCRRLSFFCRRFGSL